MMKTLINIIALLFLTFLSLTAQQKKATVQEEFTFITGKLDKNIKSDTLYLILHGQFQSNVPEKGAIEILKTMANREGYFTFKIPSKKYPFHISLFLSSRRDSSFNLLNDLSDVKNFLIEPGDSIHIKINNKLSTFSGKNSALFDAQYAIRKTDPDEKKLGAPDKAGPFAEAPGVWMTNWDDMLSSQLNLLSTFKLSLTPLSYSIVKADVLGANRYRVYHVTNFFDMFFGKHGDKYNKLQMFLQELEQRPAYIKYDDPSALSPRYVEYLYKKMVVEIKYSRAIGKTTGQKYDYFSGIVNAYPEGPLRDKLLVRWIKSMAGFNIMQPRFLDSALKAVKTPIYTKMLNDFKHTFSEGAEVADYNFKDANDRTVRLADFKGKVLMIDMWFSGCGPCVDVAKGLPDVEEAFKNRKDIEFISISTDKDKNRWLKSIDSDTTGKDYTHFTTKSTIYLNTAGTGTENSFIKKYNLEGFPILLIIDKKGRVYSSTPSRPTSKQRKAELIAQLNEASNVEN